ncbi:MAG: sodium:solute symporter, partial [Capnocytophaga sp.]|nr:sodium:solute symporter [Capnocytophaga sp.]
KTNEIKEIPVTGFFVAIAMIGLDQNMMQKTLTCKNVWDAQKNTLTYSFVLATTQILFLCLGVLLYIYAENMGITLETNSNGVVLNTDNLFPDLALNYLGVVAGISFLLGVIAASFSSIDSALTALTTSFTYDFLDISGKSSQQKNRIKNLVLFGFSTVIFCIIMLFSQSKGDVISLIFNVAGYTYGPLLGLFIFGMFTQIKIHDKWVWIVCIASPLLTYLSSIYLKNNFNFDFGFVSIAVNGFLTFIGLFLLRKK